MTPNEIVSKTSAMLASKYRLAIMVRGDKAVVIDSKRNICAEISDQPVFGVQVEQKYQGRKVLMGSLVVRDILDALR